MIRIHQSLFSPHPGAEASASAGRLTEKIVDVEIEKDEAVRELWQLIQE